MKDHDDGALEFVDEDLQQAVLFDDVDGDQLWTKTDKRQQKMYTTPPGWKDFVFFPDSGCSTPPIVFHYVLIAMGDNGQ